MDGGDRGDGTGADMDVQDGEDGSAGSLWLSEII